VQPSEVRTPVCIAGNDLAIEHGRFGWELVQQLCDERKTLGEVSTGTCDASRLGPPPCYLSARSFDVIPSALVATTAADPTHATPIRAVAASPMDPNPMEGAAVTRLPLPVTTIGPPIFIVPTMRQGLHTTAYIVDGCAR